jgi:hypothetical protein
MQQEREDHATSLMSALSIHSAASLPDVVLVDAPFDDYAVQYLELDGSTGYVGKCSIFIIMFSCI